MWREAPPAARAERRWRQSLVRARGHCAACTPPLASRTSPPLPPGSHPARSGPGKQTLKIFDGSDAVQRNHFRVITTTRLARSEEVLVRGTPRAVVGWASRAPLLYSRPHPAGGGTAGLLHHRRPSQLRAAGAAHAGTCWCRGRSGQGREWWDSGGGRWQGPRVPRGCSGGVGHPSSALHRGGAEGLPCLAQVRPHPARDLPGGQKGVGYVARAPETVPCRVAVAYVSIRVTPQSTARTVVLEVLPLLGRQVRTLRPATVWGPARCPGRWCWCRPDARPHPPQAEGAESFQLVEVLMGSRHGEWSATGAPGWRAPRAEAVFSPAVQRTVLEDGELLLQRLRDIRQVSGPLTVLATAPPRPSLLWGLSASSPVPGRWGFEHRP